MNIGMIGGGKLGTPVALAIESRGYDVSVYDINPQVGEQFRNRSIPYKEEGIQPYLNETKIHVAQSIGELVASSDILFAAIQTPHDKEFEGITRLPDVRKDFDYSFLKQVVGEVATQAELQGKPTTLAVISTCLPGTFEREIRPLLNKWVDYAYTPAYIAMGTVINDYLHPEFSLIGQDSEGAARKLQDFFDTIHDRPQIVTDITTAEGIKVFYNTFITAKILLANSWMQTAHKTGMNVDDITKALSLATDRLLSPKYMTGGGPDSGGCHPRDLIALSWLGEQIDLKPNFYEMMAQAREQQTEWTADLIEEEYKKEEQPVYILGKAFKPETNLTTGSGATLLANILKERGIEPVQFDPYIDTETPRFEKGIYFVATKHDVFREFDFPKGSTVLDLWRYIEPKEGINTIHIGKNTI